jgi:acyl-CoA thioester hydrolase
VFHARWVDYVDVATCEFARAVLGSVTALDWRLVKQTLEWQAPGRFDDVLAASVQTLRVGTTSFALATEFHRGDRRLVRADTVYVVVDPASGDKRPVPDDARAALERGAPGVVVDQAGPAS